MLEVYQNPDLIKFHFQFFFDKFFITKKIKNVDIENKESRLSAVESVGINYF